MTQHLTIDQLARALVTVGYERDDIRATLVSRFPGGDVDEALDKAYAWNATIELDLAEGQERDERSAREAEHDLSKTNQEE